MRHNVLIHISTRAIHTIQPSRPCTYIYIAFTVFGERFCIDIRHRMATAVSLHHRSIRSVVIFEFLGLMAVACHSLIGTYPQCSVVRGIQCVYLTRMFDLEMIGSESSTLLVQTHQSVACSYPQTVVLVLCHRQHRVVGQQIGGLCAATIRHKAIAVVRLDTRIGAHPQESLAVYEHTLLFHRCRRIDGIKYTYIIYGSICCHRKSIQYD